MEENNIYCNQGHFIYFINYINFKKKFLFFNVLKNNTYKIWGLGIGDWGLGIGDWGLGPIPNPQSPIPNPQSPMPFKCC
jgi:hypothetical protein